MEKNEKKRSTVEYCCKKDLKRKKSRRKFKRGCFKDFLSAVCNGIFLTIYIPSELLYSHRDNFYILGWAE